MSKKISRRSFLKIIGGATAAGVAAGALPVAARDAARRMDPVTRPPEETLPGDGQWYASTCRMCSSGCGIIVRVVNGRARKIEGNPQHPLNKGKLCARGHAGLQLLYSPDRLKNAVRQSERESRDFAPIQWGDAIDQLNSMMEDSRPERIAFLSGIMPDHLYHVSSTWLEAIGAPPPLMYELQAEIDGLNTAGAGAKQLFGSDQLPIYDIANADVIFSFGSNFLETWQSPVSYSVDYGVFRQGQTGGRGFFAQFEPRLSATAASADQWIPNRPGTEGLIALALGRIIVEERLGATGTFGQSYARMYSGVSVQTLANASGVSADELYRLANILAGADRPVVIPGGAPSGHVNATGSYQAIQALNLVLTRLGRRGGIFLTQRRPGETFTERPHPNSYGDVLELIKRMVSGKVDLLLISGANPAYELPSSAEFVEALKNVKSVVSFNSFVDETGLRSDLILPDDSYLESWGYQVVSPGADRPAVSGQQPVVERLYDTRSTISVIMSLAQRAGGKAAAAIPWLDEKLFVEDVSGSLFGSSLSPWPARTAGEFWAAWRQHGGWWSDRELRREPEPVGFANRPLPAAGPEFNGSAREYPLHLYPYSSVAMADGRGANLPWLQELPDPMTTASWQSWIEINPETASRLGVHDNDVVRIISPAGEAEAVVVIFRGIRPDVVAIPMGQGHEEFGQFANGRGINVMDLIVSARNEGGSLAWGATRVRLEPTGKQYNLARLESLDGDGREKIT